MPRAAQTLLLLLALAAAGCGGSGSKGSQTAAKGRAPASRSPSGCRDEPAPKPRRPGPQPKPTARLDSSRRWEVRLRTSCGDLTIRLAVNASPRTTASFVSLVRRGFFDRTLFHRIVSGFVIQGGDPTGTGAGGPGYTTRDVPPRGTDYRRGVVAMAKTQQEPSGTAGSQFYVVTAPDAGLPPEYALLGRVVKGMAVADRIDKLGDPASGEAGTPLRPVLVERARVHAS